MKGPTIKDWAGQGALNDIDDVAKSENWNNLLPPLLKDVVTYEDKYVAAPVNIHRINWIWANPQVLEKAGVVMPTTWDEFNAAADKLKAAGITPLAHGGQPWQDAGRRFHLRPHARRAGLSAEHRQLRLLQRQERRAGCGGRPEAVRQAVDGGRLPGTLQSLQGLYPRAPGRQARQVRRLRHQVDG